MKLLRDPLFHFAILGIVLFLAWAAASDLFAPDAGRRIEIGEAEVEFLAGNFSRQWQRPPTEDELRALVDSRVREEVLYREALALGLDRNDMVVRRRMVQKMDLLSEDIAMLADPTDAELRTFFGEEAETYRIPVRISFSHVYFNLDARGATAEDDARRALAALRAETPPPVRAPDRGDRFMLEFDYVLLEPGAVQQRFGKRFADALMELEPGWHGPLVSGYGYHLVYVSEREASRRPEFEEVRGRLVLDYNRRRRERAREALLEGLREGYEITVDEEAVRRAALSRTAPNASS